MFVGPESSPGERPRDERPSPQPPESDEVEARGQRKRSRMAMTLREAEVIAENLKETGSRR